MKGILRGLAAMLCVLVLCVGVMPSAFAHSGRTDGSGGHKDNKNASGLGGYHYHCGGHPAHLHTGGHCPYREVFPTGVSLKADRSELKVGEQAVISASVSPSNACDTGVTWESSDTAVAKIKGGELEAVGEGTVTITATTFNGKTASVTLTVETAPTEESVPVEEPPKSDPVAEEAAAADTFVKNTAPSEKPKTTDSPASEVAEESDESSSSGVVGLALCAGAAVLLGRKFGKK